MDNHIFRSALGGFNRQDVMEYIEKVQRLADERAASLEQQLEEALRSGGEARQELEECARTRQELEQQLEELRVQCSHARNNWDAQSQAKEAFRRDLADREETIQTLNAEQERLKAQLEELRVQLGDVRRQKEQIAQLELDARQRSDDTIAKAEARASIILADTQAKADADLAEARQKAQDIISAAEVQARETTAQAQARAENTLQAAEVRIGETAGAYEDICRSAQAAVGQIGRAIVQLSAASEKLPEEFGALGEALAALKEQAGKR